MKSNVWGEKITREEREGISLVPSGFPFVRTVIVLLLGGGLGMLIPLIIPNVSLVVDPEKVGGTLATLGPLFWAVVIGIIVMTIIILLRQDELALTVVIAVHLYVDWYLGLSVIALIMAIALLCLFFLARSPQRPWVEPQALWLWVLFLVLTISPAIRGALTPRDALLYYPNVIFGALIMFWLGTVIARDTASVRRFFKILSGFGVLIAVHTIIQATTGITLLGSSRVDVYLASVSNYELAVDSNIYRLGSFFIQPNFAGTFFAMMVFIPLGLFVESSSFQEKVLYLAETLIMLPALLFTYSGSAWIASCVGIIPFVLLVGRTHYHIQIPLFIIVAATVMFVGFPSQVNLLFQHISNPKELLLRSGVWETALQVIRAFPLMGLGLGHLAYLQHAEPYRVPAQRIPLDHPHNSYLEWGAMAGLPVLFVFLALLAFTLWQALRNWVLADERERSLLGAGITAVIVLSANSWGNQGWTLPPLAALGWMILGAVSSPLLTKRQNNDTSQEKSNGLTKSS